MPAPACVSLVSGGWWVVAGPVTVDTYHRAHRRMTLQMFSTEEVGVETADNLFQGSFGSQQPTTKLRKSCQLFKFSLEKEIVFNSFWNLKNAFHCL